MDSTSGTPGEFPLSGKGEIPSHRYPRSRNRCEGGDTALQSVGRHHWERASLSARPFRVWLMFFAELFDQEDYNGARSHNQMKHGMAAIARDDIKMTLVRDLVDPPAPTPAELNGGYGLINAVSITHISKIWADDKGGAHGWSLRTDNADPSPCLAVAEAGICVVRSLWQVRKMIAQPGSAQDYEHNGSPLSQVVFERSSSGFQSILRELIPPTIGPVPPK